MSRKSAPPPKINETIKYHPRDGRLVNWQYSIKGIIWAAAPRASHWWARVGTTFVEVYRREGLWFESPTQGEAPERKPRKSASKILPGSVPLFELAG